MTPAPVCIIYTQDAELVRRARAFLRTMSQLRHVSDPDRLEPVLFQTGPAVLIMDLRAKECRELVDQIQNEHPGILIIALGVPQSETLREAGQYGIYAAEEIGLERRRFQALLARAFDYLKVSQENRDLRETSIIGSEPPRREEIQRSTNDAGRVLSLLRFPRVLRRLDKMDTLLAAMVESLVDAAGVSRVGLCFRTHKDAPYRLGAG